MKANHKETTFVMNGVAVTLKTGQLLTGRKVLSAATHINESKIQRLLKLFESLHMIEQQTTNKNRVLTVLNWSTYQASEQQVNNRRTTSEQQVNTYNNENNANNENKKKGSKRFAPPSLAEAKSYITEKNLNTVDAESFINFYESKGWMVGKNKMKSWKATISGWHSRNKKGQNNGTHKKSNTQERNDMFNRATADAYN